MNEFLCLQFIVGPSLLVFILKSLLQIPLTQEAGWKPINRNHIEGSVWWLMPTSPAFWGMKQPCQVPGAAGQLGQREGRHTDRTQGVSGFAKPDRQPEFNPRNPYGRREEPNPAGCPPTHTRVAYTYPHTTKQVTKWWFFHFKSLGLRGSKEMAGERRHTERNLPNDMHGFTKPATYLPVTQVTETTNNLLFIQLICLELHSPHSLHHPVVLEAILSGEHCGDWRALF